MEAFEQEGHLCQIIIWVIDARLPPHASVQNKISQTNYILWRKKKKKNPKINEQQHEPLLQILVHVCHIRTSQSIDQHHSDQERGHPSVTGKQKWTKKIEVLGV